MKNKLIFFTLGFLSFYIIAVIPKWEKISTNFFDIRLIEIVQVLTTLFIAIFITYFINKQINNELRKKEILNTLFEKSHILLKDILTLSLTYINNPEEESEQKIKLLFQEVSKLISIIKKADNNLNKSNSSNLRKYFLSFKKSITDTPFGTQKKFPHDKKYEIIMNYQFLSNSVYKSQLDLFSQ